MNEQNDAIISIHPRYADAILNGDKTIELRRRIPRTAIGTRLWIYATRPLGAVVGSAIVSEVLRGSPKEIWKLCKADVSIARKDYDEYFEGAETAIGIVLTNVIRRQPIMIEQLREMKAGFHPPQVLAKLSSSDTRSLSKLAYAV